MRPLRLEVKGFTAFRDPAEIDFTGFDVFAIAGPTGSGKSSLLDAMTYALYGRVERVGDRVGQLISQGQPRMAVTLEFEVGTDRYRVTRSTPAKGATKILLERLTDGEWQQAGDGADRVKPAESLIVRTIGLTYDGFTRSVLLPQGRFAEFLVGDPKKRRDILTELLGLSLFRRMAERANVISKKAADEAKWTADMLEQEFADVTREAVKEARSLQVAAGRREQSLLEARERVAKLLARWREAERSVEVLRAAGAEFVASAAGARVVAEELEELAARAVETRAAVAQSAAAAGAADLALEAAREALRAADATGGSAKELAEARLAAHGLHEAVRNLAARTASRTEALAAAAVSETAVGAAEAIRSRREEALTRCEAEVASCEAHLEAARHADLVAAVSSGLRAGDPCPVCARPLEEAPAVRAGALDDASRARDAARTAADAARSALVEAERAAERARRELQAAVNEGDRLQTEREEIERSIGAFRGRLIPVLGDPLPEDPAKALEERSTALEGLVAAERDADRMASTAAQAALRAEQDRDRVDGEIERRRDRLAADHGPVFERAGRALGRTATPPGCRRPPQRPTTRRPWSASASSWGRP